MAGHPILARPGLRMLKHTASPVSSIKRRGREPPGGWGDSQRELGVRGSQSSMAVSQYLYVNVESRYGEIVLIQTEQTGGF